MSESEHSSVHETSVDSDYLNDDYYSDDSETSLGYLGNDGYYPKDEKDSNLVTAASAGNLEAVKRIVQDCPPDLKAGTLNCARKWTEVDEKMGGYDKSWEWFGDTAIIAAARAGHVEVVQYLLMEGADPTLSSCPRCDGYETAQKAVEDREKHLDSTIEKIKMGTIFVSEHDVEKDAKIFVRGIIEKQNRLKIISDLLKEAGKYWDRAKYASESYSKERSKAFAENPNKPTNLEDLRRGIASTVATLDVDQEVLDEVAAKYALLIEKKKVEVSERGSQFNSSKRSINVVQVVGHSSPYSKRLKHSSECQGAGCTRLPAQACTHGCCAHCCSGFCPRHGLPYQSSAGQSTWGMENKFNM